MSDTPEYGYECDGTRVPVDIRHSDVVETAEDKLQAVEGALTKARYRIALLERERDDLVALIRQLTTSEIENARIRKLGHEQTEHWADR